MNLLLTLVVGILILVGSALVFLFKNNNRFINFATSLGFGVMSALILLELIPEVVELLSVNHSILKTIFLTIFYVFVGIIVLKVLDKFIPDHDNKKVSDNLFHIAIVSSVSLIIHNILEGMAVYSSLANSFDSGIFVCLGVGAHNIALGMVITSFFYKSNNDKKKTLLIMLGIALSTFLGGILALIIGSVSQLVEGIILAITLGMLIYITLFEFLPHVLNTKYKKDSIIGVVIGILVLIIGLLLG